MADYPRPYIIRKLKNRKKPVFFLASNSDKTDFSSRREIPPGQYYHLYNRGNDRQRIFLDDENYKFFLRRLREYLIKARANLVAYCLMPNHYHAIIYLEGLSDFSNILRGFTTSYARSFNRWHNRVGYLCQGNTQAKLIDTEEYLIHLCRYIHLNPVTAGLVDSPENWQHSDYGEWISDGELVTSPIQDLRKKHFASAKEYQRFVMDYAAEARIRGEIESRLFGGTE